MLFSAGHCFCLMSQHFIHSVMIPADDTVELMQEDGDEEAKAESTGLSVYSSDGSASGVPIASTEMQISFSVPTSSASSSSSSSSLSKTSSKTAKDEKNEEEKKAKKPVMRFSKEQRVEWRNLHRLSALCALGSGFFLICFLIIGVLFSYLFPCCFLILFSFTKMMKSGQGDGSPCVHSC